MDSLEDIYSRVIHLPYDMRVEFCPLDGPQAEPLVQAVYWLRLADGTSEKAGTQRVSVELLRMMAEKSLVMIFSNHAETLINRLSQ